MSAIVRIPLHARAQQQPRARHIPKPAPQLALLGTGKVGRAFVERAEALRARGVALPAFAWLSNTRALADGGDSPLEALAGIEVAPPRQGPWAPWVENAGLRPGDVMVDATASDSVAGWHSEWLARGIHVVTANKLGNGSDLARAQAIVEAGREGGVRYGDSATVGAGLPLLRSIRALQAGGDRIAAVQGVLSGSLAWLFDRYDGSGPFSALVREAREQGYAEPDPRIDLSGEDVRRKLLILARAAGQALDVGQVQVESLLTDTLAAAGGDAADGLLASLDAPVLRRFEEARGEGRVLRFVGSFDADGARARLEALSPADPLATGGGTDNVVAISSCRYARQPLVVRGPGAGAGVTAAALLDDVLEIVRA